MMMLKLLPVIKIYLLKKKKKIVRKKIVRKKIVKKKIVVKKKLN